MDFDFFVFLVFMSFVSFAVAFLAYAAVVRVFGTEGAASRYSQIFFIPLCIIAYDFFTITVDAKYRYVVGAIPMLLIGLIVLYYRFGASGAYYDAPSPSDFKKPESSKSKRIRESRAKRKK